MTRSIELAPREGVEAHGPAVARPTSRRTTGGFPSRGPAHRVAALVALVALAMGIAEPTWRTAAAAGVASSASSSAVTDASLESGEPLPGAEGGAGAAAAIGCGLGIRALILVGPIFGLILATVAVCTYAMFEGAIDPSP